MPNWNEAEYLKRAGEVARDFVNTGKPLGDLCEKIARDETLAPDEIRTLVRLSNVAAFQQIFRDKAHAKCPDRMVEFEVGDPEAVIQRIQSAAARPQESANVVNDKLAFEIPDRMREVRLGHAFDRPGDVKTASMEVPLVPPVRRDLAILAARKLATDFEIDRRIAGSRWERAIETLASRFRKAAGYGPDHASFETDAWSEYAMDAQPELTALREVLRMPPLHPDQQKVALLRDHHVTSDTPELQILGEAVEDRRTFTKLSSGLAWLTRNTPRI